MNLRGNMYKDTKKLLSEAKFYESYSRFIDDLNRYETWNESVDRVMNMHREFYKDKMTQELSDLIDEATGAYKERRVLGAQRALQFGGEQLLRHQLKLYNCLGSFADRPDFFGEYFYGLLCGCGVGVSVQKHHIAKLPHINLRTKQPKMHVIEDSIEGWATSLDVLLSSYFEGGGKHPEFEGRKVYFDLTNIRPRGAKISGGFKAPGPEPLRLALDKIEYILQGVALKKRQKLSPIQVYDICMHTADGVLAGGVRRCLPEWYEVKTTNGWKQIKDIVPNEDMIEVPEGVFKVTNKFNQGFQRLYKIITDSGCHFSTGNHKWLVFNKNTTEIQWVEASKLSQGNYQFLKPK